METCRVCLKQSNLLLNFTLSDCDRFLLITGLEVKDPHDEFLCESCLNRLDVAFTFREDSIKANQQLSFNHNGSFEAHEDKPHQLPLKCDTEENEMVVEEYLESDEDYFPEETLKQENVVVTPVDPKPYVGPYKCGLCDEEFRYKRHRNLHIRQHNSRERTFSCEFDGCDRKFTQEASMRRHMHDRHISKDKYVCEMCAMRCASKQTLITHMRTHTGEKPYFCKEPDCNKAFRRTSDLFYHQASHSDKRPYICADCGASYKLKMGLRTHMTTAHGKGAKMLPCPECNKAFLFKNMLENHIAAIHRGERSYECGECTKSYTRGNHLKRHYHDSHPEMYDDFVRQELHLKRNNVN